MSTSLLGYKGWQQMGAVENIKDLSIFNDKCIDYIWYYDNNDTSNPFWRLHTANGNDYGYCGETLTSLSKGQGFWVNANSECNITIADSSTDGNCTSSMPAPPDIENPECYTCDTNITLTSAGTSCKTILDAGLSKGDGTYIIDPDEDGPNKPFKI